MPANRNNQTVYIGIGLVVLLSSLWLQWVRVLDWAPGRTFQLITVGDFNGLQAGLFSNTTSGLYVPSWLLVLAAGIALLMALLNNLRVTQIPKFAVLLPGAMAFAGLLFLLGALFSAEKLQPSIGPVVALAGLLIPAIPLVVGKQEALFHHAPARQS